MELHNKIFIREAFTNFFTNFGLKVIFIRYMNFPFKFAQVSLTMLFINYEHDSLTFNNYSVQIHYLYFEVTCSNLDNIVIQYLSFVILIYSNSL